MEVSKKNITLVHEIGARQYQEDRYGAFSEKLEDGTKLFIFAVMDGHRDDKVSQFVFEYLSENLDPVEEVDCEVYISNLFASINEQTKGFSSGTTCSVAFLYEKTGAVFTAVLGDSPVFIGNEKGLTFLSQEHNVASNENEKAAVIERGGICERGYIVIVKDDRFLAIQTTRVFGDSDFEQFVSRVPTIEKHYVAKGDVLIICSDGFVECQFMTLQETAGRIVGEIPYMTNIQELNDLRAEEFGPYTDNATALIIRL